MYEDKVKHLAWIIVDEIAPDQAPLFDSVADGFVEELDQVVLDSSSTGPLGSGLQTTFGVVIPIAIVVADHVLSAVLDVTLEGLTKSATRRIKRMARRRIDPYDAAAVRADVIEVLRRYRRAEVDAEAGRIADLVVRALPSLLIDDVVRNERIDPDGGD